MGEISVGKMSVGEIDIETFCAAIAQWIRLCIPS